MKKALISSNEIIETGYRIAEVSDYEFPIANPLYWIDCEDNINADFYFFDSLSNSIKEKSPVELKSQPMVEGVQTL